MKQPDQSSSRRTRVAPDPDVFFREVTLRVSSSLDMVTALHRVLDYLKDFIPSSAIGLYRFDADRHCIFAVAEVSDEGATKSTLDHHPVFSVDAEFMQIIRRRRAELNMVNISEPGTLPASVLQCFPHLATRSVISLRLTIDGEEVGGLAISAEGAGIYHRNHIKLLEHVMEPLALAMSNAWRFLEVERLRDRLAEENRALSMDMERSVGVQVIGADFGLSQVMELVRRVAPLSSPVLLLGETGAGKEVIANAIHLSSPRNQAPMVRVPCGAIPETLLDSELFGHEKGAFTGAIDRKRGRFERAAGGTIFLDEIGELTAEAQVKLLRVLQDKQFERVGGTETLTSDARIIAATHRDLARMVREGRFREDLWYRLNVFPIMIPPLRMRKDDIPPLALYFIERKAREMNLERIPAIDSTAIAHLQEYDWPGNVRELQNVIERAIILSRGGPLTIPPLHGRSDRTKGVFAPAGLPEKISSLDETIAGHIHAALQVSGGRVSGPGGAAEMLQLNPNTLRSKMRKLGIKVARSARG
jgi:transcriptional regulator with GAF, ATPase, and Fis domain